jgi:hypothetical protein
VSGFSVFAIYAGIFLALIGLVAAWLFRTSDAPFHMKWSVPVLIIILACATPDKVAALLGYPVWTTFSALPQKAELIGFVPKDSDKQHLVDLWLRVGSDDPRAYEVIMTGDMKKMLKDAGAKMAQGERVGLRKGKPRDGVTDIETPEAPYVLDDNAFALPSKDK